MANLIKRTLVMIPKQCSITHRPEGFQTGGGQRIQAGGSKWLINDE